MVWMLYWFITMSYFIRKGHHLAKITHRYTRFLFNGKPNIVFVGDSTAVGTGASNPEKSVPGLLAKEYPQASITNIAINGAKISDMIRQLKKLDQHYDLIMMHISGNDIVKLTPFSVYQTNIKQALTIAKQKAHHVLFVPTGNVGAITIFPKLIRLLMQYRTKKIREISLKAVQEAGEQVRYVDFFLPTEKDPFAIEPKRCFAEDRFHPSDLGYSLWMPEINQELSHFFNN